jgi:hypothetical protein
MTDLQFAITRVHVGCESLLMDNFSSECGQEITLFTGKSGTKVGFVFGG